MIPLRSFHAPARVPANPSRRHPVSEWVRHGWAGAFLVLAFVVAGCDEDPLLFAAPDRVEAISPTELVGTVSRPTPEVPRVRVTDRRGNPVPGTVVRFEVVDGDGSVETVEAISDTRGIASPGGWTLGPRTGPNRLEARIGSLTPVAFTAEATVGVEVAAVHINQGSQTFPGHIPALAGRDGLLRVFLQANAPNAETPDVRIDLYDGSTQVASHVVPAPASQVPTSLEPALPTGSWNLHLPGSLVSPQLGVRIFVDEDEEMDVVDRSTLAWPEDGSIHRPAVHQLPPFRATFIRIFSEDLGTTADLNEENLDDYMSTTLDLFPIAKSDAVIRPGTYVTEASPLTGPQQGQGWTELLQEIWSLRLMDAQDDPAASDRYYHGILRRAEGPGIAGVAYVAQHPTSTALAALSHDAPGTRSRVVAHEFGHNFGRLHAPCGNPGALDSAYPHDNARLGSPGYLARTRTVISPIGNFRDIMSYCTPSWVSDYTYEAVLDMRRARPIGSPAATAGVAAGIRIFGEWSREEGARLQPAVEGRGSAAPTRGGEAELRGYDREGRLLFRQEVRGVPLDHVDDPTLRHFHVFVPLAPEDREALSRIELSTPQGDAARQRPGIEPGIARVFPPSGLEVEVAPPPVGAAAPGPGASSWIRVRWNVEHFPMMVLRDADSGHVLTMARRGEIRIPRPSSGVLLVQLSDGVGSLDEAVRLP
jgi:hypothetical protein